MSTLPNAKQLYRDLFNLDACFIETGCVAKVLATTSVNFPDVKSRNSSQRFPVSVVQARPHLLDLASTLKKTLQLIEQAARRGSKLVCFGETWLPGYPAWLDFCNEVAIWNHAPVKQVYAQLRANSVPDAHPVFDKETIISAELDFDRN